MASRGLPHQKDLFAIDAIAFRVGMQEANRTLEVLVTGGRGRATNESIVDGHGEEAKSSPLSDFDGRGVSLMSTSPTASMD